MKKLFTVFTVVFLATTMSLAQDLTSKKGENYLPEGDEWSIGFDATSLLNYFGNFLNSNASAPTVNSPYSSNGATFYGKKVIDDNSAWRARVEFGLGSNSYSNPLNINYTDEIYVITPESLVQTTDGSGNIITVVYVDPITGIPAINEVDMTSNELKEVGTVDSTVSRFAMNFWVGKEWRRGSTRLQGVYGAEAGLGFSSPTKTSVEYSLTGEQMYRDQSNSVDERLTERKTGSSFMLGARVFIGVEYFILPKISLGAEYGWGLALTSQGADSKTTETTTQTDGGDDWDDYNANLGFAFDEQYEADTWYTADPQTTSGQSGGSFGLLNDLRGSIAVNFYF